LKGRWLRLLRSALLGIAIAGWFLALSAGAIPSALLLIAGGVIAVGLELPRRAGLGATANNEASGTATPAGRVLDSSAIIDPRLLPIVESGFLAGPLLIPDFVLQELQRVADSGEGERRERGRTALAAAQRLLDNPHPPCQIHASPGSGPVDDRLVALCRELASDLVTTDHNLQRVAEAHGVKVLNPNQLAVALRAPQRPGARLLLRVERTGREPGQGLGTLADGTLVVIEGGAGHVGCELNVVVVREAQSERGRILFARPTPKKLDGAETDT
jgi:uncharacterized protein YacL